MSEPVYPLDSGDGRDETPNERFDRNWDELLQELRVTQTGTQIVSGFLLTLAFQQRFADLNGFQTAIYLVLVVLAAATTAVGLAIVSLHRTLFRRHEKRRMVTIGNRLLDTNLVLVAVLTGGVVLFIFDFVTGWVAGVIAGALVVLLLLFVLVLLPRSVRDREPKQ
jgi:hypothetical protein